MMHAFHIHCYWRNSVQNNACFDSLLPPGFCCQDVFFLLWMKPLVTQQCCPAYVTLLVVSKASYNLHHVVYVCCRWVLWASNMWKVTHMDIFVNSVLILFLTNIFEPLRAKECLSFIHNNTMFHPETAQVVITVSRRQMGRQWQLSLYFIT